MSEGLEELYTNLLGIEGAWEVAPIQRDNKSREVLTFHSIKTVAENFSLSWNQVDRFMERTVERGLRRRKKSCPQHIGIDETAFQRRHEYVTVILDKDADTVIDILDDSKAETLDNLLAQHEKGDFYRLESITMDMWDPFIKSVKKHFENSGELIAFDRFHFAGHFAKALNKVRAAEHRELASESLLTQR